MSSPLPPGHGPFDSIRAMGATLVALVHTRVELAVLELREEGERRKQMLVLAVAAGVFLTLAAGLLALIIVVLFRDTHRLAAAGGVTVAYLAIGILAVMKLKAAARDNPPPFEATLAELAKDVAAMKGPGHE